ncbi:MAG: 3-deoxy-D-manno-octulosonic acid transferase [Candidatus Omnitrophota bacterium]
MFIIYDLIFFIFILIFFPVYLFKGKFHQGFSRRFGCLPKDLNLNRPIWVHAVSVGEVVAIKGLVEQLRKIYPDKKIVISTVTTTGNKVAQGLIKEGDFLTYLPLDFSFIVRKVLKKIDPCLFIIAETEIWPNLINCLDRLKVPLITVNGRISDSSFGGYRAIKLFIQPILKKINQFCVQSSTDALRLQKLGVSQENIQITGNVKFDINLEMAALVDGLGYRKRLGLDQNDQLLVCGSTHSQEEEIIIDAYQQLLLGYPKLKLLIAPRHPQRAKEIADLAVKNSFMPILISNISTSCPTCVNKAVFILDVIGQLFNYYAAADIVFMGGSLIKKGGHNIIEPASLKRPVIFGPQMFNFRDISELFINNQAAFMVKDGSQLVSKIKEILNNPLLAKEMTQRAYDLIISHKGATLKNIQVIQQLGGKYVW